MASLSVVCPGVIPQKQGASQSTESCKRVLIVSFACSDSSVAGSVAVAVSVGVKVEVDVGGIGVDEETDGFTSAGAVVELAGTQPEMPNAITRKRDK